MEAFGFACAQKRIGVTGMVFERRFVPGIGVVTAGGTILGGIDGEIIGNEAQDKAAAHIEFTPTSCGTGPCGNA